MTTQIEETNAVIIGLHKPDREVFWFVEGYVHDNSKIRLYSRMEDYLANGNTFTILEYHPRGWSLNYGYIGERASWWDEQLREQGYDIWVEEEEHDIEGN